MKLYKDAPEEGELVVVEVDDIHEHSASVHIEGYDLTGLIHISEVSRSWVRDISQHLDEGEKTVAQVVEVDDGTYNLSLKRVNDNQKREKMDEWRKEQKADKFLQKVADRLDVDRDDLYEAVAFPFQKEYGSAFEGFERAAMDDVDFDALGIDDDTAEAIADVASDNISLKRVELEGELELTVPGDAGIDAIREALQVDEHVEVAYRSAPEYAITVWGRNQEDAKERMEDAVDRIRGRIEDAGGAFTFTKK